MAMNAYLTLESEGNPIEGDSTVGGENENDIEVLEFHHEVSIPVEHRTTQRTSARVHHPLTIKKRVDKSSPLLYKALTCNENLTTAIIKFYRPNPDGSGAREHFFSIEMGTAVIVKITPYLPNTLDQRTSNLPAMEDISFAYRDITWTYETTGAIHMDTWDQS